MRLLFLMARDSRATLIVAILAGVLGGAASTALLFVINSGLSHHGSITSTLVYTFLGLAGLAMITRAGSALLLARIGTSALFQLRMGLSRQILGVPLRRLEEVGAPRLLGILTDDVLNITNAVANLPLICVNVAGLLTCLVFLAWLSWVLFLSVVVLIVLGIVTYQLPFYAASRHFVAARKEHNNILSHLRSLIFGIKELKINRMRRKVFLSELLEGSADRFQAHSMSAMKIYILGATWGEMLSFITIGLLVFVAPHLTLVSTSTLTAFVLVLIYVMEPLQFIMNQGPTMSKASVALKNVESMGLTLAKNDSEEDAEVQALAKPSWNSIDLKQVAFSYERDDGEGKFAVGPFDLTLTPGKLVFITGGNGSGKTTLAKLLVGLYRPEHGRILLDGMEIGDKDRDNFRQYFSAVFSDFYLFDSFLGLEQQHLDSKATAYLQRLQLSHKVKVTDGTLSTVDLSQGQRKRLALLTAYLEDRHIFLFDEWAADQDATFKDIFYYQILPELKARRKAVIVISHDERYYEVADRVIKLENGQIVSDQQCKPGIAREMVV
jgi:putative ATP-binding cassette transporter